MRSLGRSVACLALALCCVPAGADSILRYEVLPRVPSSVEPAGVLAVLEQSEDCAWYYSGRWSLAGEDLYLDLIAEGETVCLTVVIRPTVEVSFGVLPEGRYRAHVRLLTRRFFQPGEVVNDEEVQDLLVRAGQTDLHLLHRVLPPPRVPFEPLPVEITGMAGGRASLYVTDRFNNNVLSLNPDTLETIDLVASMGAFQPDAISNSSRVLARHPTRKGQFLLSVGRGGVISEEPIDLTPGGPLEGMAIGEAEFYGRAEPPEIFGSVFFAPGFDRLRLVGTGIPLTSLDDHGWRFLGVDPGGPSVVLIDSVRLEPPTFFVEVGPVELNPVGALVDARSYPPEHTPSAAAVAGWDDRVIMTGRDSKMLEFRPLRIGMTPAAEVRPLWPPFLGSADILGGELGTSSLFDGGVLLGRTRCLREDLPNGATAPTPDADPPPGSGIFFLARPGLTGADYGPAGQGLRRVVAPEADCAPAL